MGEYITDCLVSVLESEYIDKEIIIVDDGSTDIQSIEVLKKLETKHPINVYRKQNEGLPKARNYGAEKATGYYLAFLDADDTIEKSYYKKAISVLSNYSNIHFVGCWTKYTGNSKGNWPTFNPEPPYLLIHNMINSSALVYRKKSFIVAGLNNPNMEYGMEDWDSVISMIKHNYFGVVLPELLFNYRIRKGSMARSFTEIKQLYLQSLISKNHKPLYEKFGSDIFQLLNANGSGLSFDNPTFATPTQGYLSFLNLNSRLTEKIKKIIKRNKQLRKIAYKIYSQIKK
jgi:glycosyltransferase involved in cell wall biosynthesis